MGGLKSVSVVHIEFSNIDNFSMWVRSQQRLIVRGKIFKERDKVSSIRRAIAKSENNRNCREINLKLEDVRVRRFMFHEPCNRCVYVTISTDTTFRMKTTVKVIVGDLTAVSERSNKFGKDVAKWVTTEGKLELRSQMV